MKLGLVSKLTGKMSLAALKASKYAPEMLIVAGGVGMVATVVLACKKTLKTGDILDRHKEDMDVIKEEVESGSISSDKEKRKATFIAYSHTVVDMGKLYAPAAALGAVSMGCIFASFGILKKRNLALAAAYSGLLEAYKGYRREVIAEYGEGADKKFAHKAAAATAKKADDYTEEAPRFEYSDYARFFDSGSPHWDKNPEYNFMFLKAQQEYANNLLHTRKYVLLNDVYDMLGIPRSSAGCVVGWVEGNGDDFIDFGFFDPKNWKNRDFVNGYENVVLLDFNVDGVIYDKI